MSKASLFEGGAVTEPRLPAAWDREYDPGIETSSYVNGGAANLRGPGNRIHNCVMQFCCSAQIETFAGSREEAMPAGRNARLFHES